MAQRTLARTSHHVATTARDMLQSVAFSPIGVLSPPTAAQGGRKLAPRRAHRTRAGGGETQAPKARRNGLSSTTPRPSGRKHNISRHLAGLATRRGEKCRLTLLAALIIGFSFITVAAEAHPSRTSVLADLVVNERVSGDVVVFAADVVLEADARVTGDVVAVGGNIRVVEGAEVGRHVMAIFGTTDVPSNATVDGRVLSFASLASLALGPGAGPPSPRLSVAVRLLASGGWLLVTTGLAFLFPVRMRYGAWALPPLGYKVPALGLLVALTVVASLMAALGLGPALGIPLIAGLMVAFFAAKVVGLTVISCTLGTAVLRRWLHHPLPISLEVFVGMLVLLVLRFLPVAGETLWSLMSVMALGATVAVIGVGPDDAVTNPVRP